MRREGGFYWVKYVDEWMIAEWYAPWGHWQTSQSSKVFHDSDFIEIDERPIVREEPKSE